MAVQTNILSAVTPAGASRSQYTNLNISPMAWLKINNLHSNSEALLIGFVEISDPKIQKHEDRNGECKSWCVQDGWRQLKGLKHERL